MNTNAQNPNLRGLREIEVDSDGNVYVLNVQKENRSDILWQYSPNGKVEGRVFLNEISPRIVDPMGLCVDDDSERIYLSTSEYDPTNVGKSKVYGLSLSDFNEEQEITVAGMRHVTGIAADGKGSLWITGFGLHTKHNEDGESYNLPNAYLAQAPTDDSEETKVTAQNLTDQASEFALPLSVIYHGK